MDELSMEASEILLLICLMRHRQKRGLKVGYMRAPLSRD
jgi:hypothetical protein